MFTFVVYFKYQPTFMCFMSPSLYNLPLPEAKLLRTTDRLRTPWKDESLKSRSTLSLRFKLLVVVDF